MSRSLARHVTSGVKQPMAEVTKLRYGNVSADNGDGTMTQVVKVTFVSPDGDTVQRRYADGKWTHNNQHLQLLAAIGHKPSDYDGNVLDVSEEHNTVPVVYTDKPSQEGWHLSQAVFKRGKEALDAADWNEFGSDSGVEVNVGGRQQ